jgi:hypothetical protein
VPSAVDASTIAAALADPERRAVFAAVVLGARNVDAVAERSGLAVGRCATAVARLAALGVVVVDDGGLTVNDAGLRAAARSARTREASNEHDAAPVEHQPVLRVFVHDGRLAQIPTSHHKRMVVLDWLVQFFEPGRRYTESAVNLIIGQRHPDTAALRRYLVDNDFLDRADGMYWRCGGSVR